MTSPNLLAPAVMLGNRYYAYVKKPPIVEPEVAITVYVSTFKGRSGDVIPTTGDYSFGQIGGQLNLNTQVFGTLAWSDIDSTPTTIAGYGILDAVSNNSPSFIGTPTAPTPATTDNSLTLATTAFVHNLFSTSLGGVTSFNGRNGAVVPVANDYTFAQIGTKPTTIAGYGITDGLIRTNNLSDVGNVGAARTNLGAAPLNSPIFTGTPAAPTPVTTDSSTALATTAFVKAVAAAGVTSFNTRTGAVLPLANDYTFSQLASIPTTIAGYGITDALKTTNNLSDVSNVTTARSNLGAAPLASPVFTGDPQAPTPLPGDNDTSIATTAFVHSSIAAAVVSFNGRTGAVVPATNDYTFAQIGTKPTTIAGYGITDTLTNTFNGRSGTVVPAANDYTFAQIGTKPTTIAGYGITDTLTNTFNGRSGTVVPAANDYTFAQLASKPTTIAGYGIIDAAPIASPAFTGTPTAPTATAGTNTTQLATTAFVEAAVAASTAGVSSFNGRTGSVMPLANDYTTAQITNYGAFSGILSSTQIGSGNLIGQQGNSTDYMTVVYGPGSGSPYILVGGGGTSPDPTIYIRGGPGTWIQSTAGANIALFTNTAIQFPVLGTTAGYLQADSSGTLSVTASISWGNISSKPTTIAGYGITDNLVNTFNSRHGAVVPAANDYTFAQLASIPTTIAGYGITDALKTTNNLSDVSNAATARTNLGAQAALGFTPVQQGTGVGQLTNAVKIGWDGIYLRATVDTTDKGQILFGPDNLASLTNFATARSNLGAAPIASPAFTGTPTAPTQAAADNTTAIATDAFVQTAVGGRVAKSGDTMTGNLTITNNTSNGYGAVNLNVGTTSNAAVSYQRSGVTRWVLVGLANGSDAFIMQRYDSSGTLAGTPLTVNPPGSMGAFIGLGEPINVTGAFASGFQVNMAIGDNSSKQAGFANALISGISTGTFAGFYNASISAVGSIAFNSTNTIYGTSSDIRLKQDEKSFTRGREIIDQIAIKDFEWIEAKERAIGVIAQEVYEAYPAAINPGIGEPEDTNFFPWQVDYSKYVPLLIEALQDAHRRIDDLTNRIIVLEGGATHATH